MPSKKQFVVIFAILGLFVIIFVSPVVVMFSIFRSGDPKVVTVAPEIKTNIPYYKSTLPIFYKIMYSLILFDKYKTEDLVVSEKLGDAEIQQLFKDIRNSGGRNKRYTILVNDPKYFNICGNKAYLINQSNETFGAQYRTDKCQMLAAIEFDDEGKPYIISKSKAENKMSRKKF